MSQRIDFRVEEPKSPTEVLDYGFDYAAVLAVGETIASSSWAIPTGMTQVSAGTSGAKAVVWVSGGQPGVRYPLTNTMTTSAGRTFVRVLEIFVIQR